MIIYKYIQKVPGQYCKI